MSEDDGVVTTERDGHVFVMTVDRADKMNGAHVSIGRVIKGNFLKHHNTGPAAF